MYNSSSKEKKDNNRSYSEIKIQEKVEKNNGKEKSSPSGRSKDSEETEPEVAEIVNRTNSKLKSILKEKKDIDGNVPEYEYKTPHVVGKKRSGMSTNEERMTEKAESQTAYPVSQKKEEQQESDLKVKQSSKKRTHSVQVNTNDSCQQHIKQQGAGHIGDKSDEMKDRINPEKQNLEDQVTKLFGMFKNYIDEKLNQTFDDSVISSLL